MRPLEGLGQPGWSQNLPQIKPTTLQEHIEPQLYKLLSLGDLQSCSQGIGEIHHEEARTDVNRRGSERMLLCTAA